MIGYAPRLVALALAISLGLAAQQAPEPEMQVASVQKVVVFVVHVF